MAEENPEMSITIHQARDLAVKLFGVYCILRVVVLVPQLISTLAFADENTTYISGKTSFVITYSIPVLLYMFLGWLLTTRTETVVAWLWRSDPDSAQDAPCCALALHFWIVLIGLFYLIQSLAGVASELWVITINRETFGQSSILQKFLPDLVLLPLSVFIIWKAKAIANLVTRRHQPPSTSNQQ